MIINTEPLRYTERKPYKFVAAKGSATHSLDPGGAVNIACFQKKKMKSNESNIMNATSNSRKRVKY